MHSVKHKYSSMKTKTNRLEAIKLIISSTEFSSQEDVLKALKREGYDVTQATLSRDLKQLKVAKAASINGKYIYVLPNETMYKRVTTPRGIHEMEQSKGYISLNFSGQMLVIKTRPGYASALAYDIDMANVPCVLGTIAGDDTIFLAIKEHTERNEVLIQLSHAVPSIPSVI